MSAAIMIGTVFGVNVVNAAVPLPNDPAAVDPGPAIPADPGQPTPGPGQPATAPVEQGPVVAGEGVDVGSGVLLRLPAGWTVVGSEAGLTAFQKAGVVMIAGGVAWSTGPLELATAYRDAWFGNGQFTGNDPQPGTIGNGVDGAALSYTGVIDNTTVDGIIATGVSGGVGVIINAFGAQGSLNGVGDDLNAVLDTVRFTGAPQ